MPKAFVSYAREDKKFVDEHVRPSLNILNVDMWIDTEDLHGAERWMEAIDRALPECDCFLVVVTRAAAASPRVREEVEWIVKNREDRLIPILAERVRFDGVHAKLPQIHHVDCVGTTPGRSATLIARALLHLADRRARTQQEQKQEISEALERCQAFLDETERERWELNRQLDQVLDFDGDWRQPPSGAVSPFVPRPERNAPIIAIMNVKGGVGKSTIAANLAATWWGRAERPKRVLLVDLDFQQSVTSLCLSAKDRADLQAGNLFVNSLFDEKVPAPEHFLKSIRRVGRGNGYILASNENLTRIETQMMARWLTQQTRKDVRFLFRELLHGPAVQEKFDAVMIDCPPRINTASINALAAADFLLVPVLLDLTSADSVPRLLEWVRSYIQAGVCPNLEILGIVANKKSDRRTELLAREENIWKELPEKCRVAWGGEVPFCGTVVPYHGAVAEYAQKPGHFACEHPGLRPIFQKLSAELEQQMGTLTELVL